VGGSRGVTTAPVSTLWGARRSLCLVGSWRKGVASWPSPVAARTQRVTSASRRSQPSGRRWMRKRRRRRVCSRATWTTVRSAVAGGRNCSSAWGSWLTRSTRRCSCGIIRRTRANISRLSGGGVSWSGRGMARSCSMPRRGWGGRRS
jgi:hypothetical protein